MKDCGTCYYRNSTWSQQHREMSAQCDHQNAPEDALLVLRVGADSHVAAPDWCPLTALHPAEVTMLNPDSERELRNLVETKDIYYVELAHVKELLDEVDRLRKLAYLGEHYFSDLTYKARYEEAIRDLQNTKSQALDAERHREQLRSDRRQLRRRLVECRPWVGVCPFPNQPGFDEMLAIRDLADDTLEEVKE